jgi:hypothetical protein
MTSRLIRRCRGAPVIIGPATAKGGQRSGGCEAISRCSTVVSQRKGPASGAFQCATVFRDRQTSGSDRQQLPVLRQNNRIDGVNDSIRCYDVRLCDAGPINPYIRGRYRCGQRTALQRHHFA